MTSSRQIEPLKSLEIDFLAEAKFLLIYFVQSDIFCRKFLKNESI